MSLSGRSGSGLIALKRPTGDNLSLSTYIYYTGKHKRFAAEAKITTISFCDLPDYRTRQEALFAFC